MRYLKIAAVTACVLTSSARAQSDAAKEAAKSTPGHWNVKTSSAQSNKLVTGMAARMTEIMNVLRRDPQLDRPPGFTVLATISAQQTAPNKMAGGTLSTIFIPHSVAEDGTIDTSGRGEGLGFAIVANNISCALGSPTDFHDKEGNMYAYEAPGSYRGMPMYKDNACILLTKTTEPPTLPVSRERVMRAVLANYDGMPAVAAGLRKQLAAMTPAERAMPAVVNMPAIVSYALDQNGDRALFSTQQSDTALRIMAPNPKFYDRTRLGDVQAIVVNFGCGGLHDSPWCGGFPFVFTRIRDNMDWAGLARLVH